MAAVGLAPSRTVVAEDVRETPELVEPQPTALWRRRLLSLWLCTTVPPRAQMRERALDLGDHSGRHAGVAGRRLKPLVSKQGLDQPNVLAIFEQMGCEGMTQRMERASCAAPRPSPPP
jgi:hypothetical protein